MAYEIPEHIIADAQLQGTELHGSMLDYRRLRKVTVSLLAVVFSTSVTVAISSYNTAEKSAVLSTEAPIVEDSQEQFFAALPPSTTIAAYEAPTTIVTIPQPPDTVPLAVAPPTEVIPPLELPVRKVIASQQSFGLERGTIGVDVSFPNCETPIPDDAKFGVVGVNHGKPYELNPCLTEQASKFTMLSLYVNSNYPGAEQASQAEPLPFPCPLPEQEQGHCVAYQWGYASGKNAVELAKSQDVTSQNWWIDVETYNAWKGSAHEHRTSLLAMRDAIKNTVADKYGDPQLVNVGFYSLRTMWDEITRDENTASKQDRLWRPDVAAWIPRYVPEPEALAFCDAEDIRFTSGKTVMIQTQRHNVNNSGKTIDVNYHC
jgi:hypothetical protein